MQGRLFTEFFLTEGIRETSEWRASLADSAAFDAFRAAIRARHDALAAATDPNESATEQDLIRPAFDILGWADYLPQQGADRNEDIPDHLLFADADAKSRAAQRPAPVDRYQDALVVQESKRFGLPLDARGADAARRSDTPHGQVLRYLATAATASDGRIRWGILTNGPVWRLYDGRARPRATAYFEVDLADALARDDHDRLRVFQLLFRRESFTPAGADAATFLETALAEGRRYEERVAQDLSSVVFERAFPRLVEALANASAATLPDVRHAALIFLYRMLFVLYAEDRGLLPVNDTRYDDYGLRRRVRDDVDERTRQGDTFSAIASNYHHHFATLCRLIDRGDPSIGLPPYNGGLFSPDAAPLLETARLSDAAMAPIVHDLSHTVSDGQPRFVNYRDMSVQQLGSIYQRLLEREPVYDQYGFIAIRPNAYARKDSGSFYTPQELVDLIIDRTLKPLAEKRRKAFEKKATELKSDRGPHADRRAELLKLDPAEAVLELKVLDPAMGSGHFLVTAVDFLSDTIAELVESAPAAVPWLSDDYESPLVARVAHIRDDILRRAAESGWVIDESQLTDRAIIRRMVLKRCIYGVDKNPLTVELAKVSLWLHSFTVGAPLSFLDHHLRCGDSLVGMSVKDGLEALRRLSGLFAHSAIQGVENAAEGMERIEHITDSDIAEAQQSAELFGQVESATSELRGVLDFLTGLRWLTAGMKRKALAAFETPLTDVLEQNSDRLLPLLARGPDDAGEVRPGSKETSLPAFEHAWRAARDVADRERFLHWQAAFPGVWRGWQNERPAGGFDAVIGNPPWERIKLQEVEWFASRAPELALAPTTAERRQRIARLREEADPLAANFDAAKEQADSLSLVARESGEYPLLGRGDINLYSLFVERSMALARPDGLVGLLTPSGIYADKTAADFFRSVSTAGRVSSLFDFENKKIFFKDVHASFKFCALVFGGEQRTFEQTDCAFFLHDPATIHDADRCFPLAPSDFARVNPNTGTAPVFRTRRDADITRGIYRRHPVLVDHSKGEDGRVWPVKYSTMFHMANDSGLFRTSAQLDEDGFYPIQGNRWKKGDELYVPLYEGKMVQAYDHRAASVVVNPENLNRPNQPESANLYDHANPDWLPKPAFWVPECELGWQNKPEWTIAIKHVSSPTNVRTVIVALAPRAGFGNSLPIFRSQVEDESELSAYEGQFLLAANLNAFALDFVARQKLQGQNLNLFILEQLPVIAPKDYDRRFGDETARELVRRHVLRLTYTAHDMAPFARDLGHVGPPFEWDEDERRHLRARLDALYFHLYGLSRADAGYILDTFPIVRRHDEAQFGRYRTRDLILAYMNALTAGDTTTDVSL